MVVCIHGRRQDCFQGGTCSKPRHEKLRFSFAVSQRYTTKENGFARLPFTTFRLSNICYFFMCSLVLLKAREAQGGANVHPSLRPCVQIHLCFLELVGFIVSENIFLYKVKAKQNYIEQVGSQGQQYCVGKFHNNLALNNMGHLTYN